MKNIFISGIPENYEDELQEKIKMLNKKRVEYLSERKIRDEFAVSVFASAAAAELAGKILNKKSCELIFCKDEFGKPFFENINGFYFSISHSFPFYAAAVSDRPIGIDVEKIRDVNLNIAKRMFTENEREYIGKDKIRFFEIWTKKEAYSKFTGKGLGEKFSSFDVLLPPLADNFTFEIKNEAACAVYTE